MSRRPVKAITTWALAVGTQNRLFNSQNWLLPSLSLKCILTLGDVTRPTSGTRPMNNGNGENTTGVEMEQAHCRGGMAMGDRAWRTASQKVQVGWNTLSAQSICFKHSFKTSSISLMGLLKERKSQEKRVFHYFLEYTDSRHRRRQYTLKNSCDGLWVKKALRARVLPG